MYKEDLYDGGVAGPVSVGEVPMGRDLVSGPLAEGMARVAANAQRAVVTGVQMEDSRREFVAKRDLIALESETRMDVERRLHLPDGHAEALFDKQGNFREVEWENLRGRVERRLEGVGAAILDPLRRQEVQAAAGLTGARLLDGLAESWQKVQRQKLEGDWKDAYDLAVAEGRIGDAMGLVDRGAEMGLFTVNRGKVMKVGLRGKGLRAAGAAGEPVKVNGKVYTGASAGLAVARAKEGGVEVQGSKAEGQSGGDLTLDEERMAAAGVVNDEGLPLTLQAGRLSEVEAAAAEGQEDEEEIRLQGEGMRTLGKAGEMPVVGQPDGAAARSMTLSEAKLAMVDAGDVAQVAKMNEFLEPGVEPEAMSEERKLWTLLPVEDVRAFCGLMDDSLSVYEVEGVDGGVGYKVKDYAPDVMQRVVARANAAGELTAEDAGEMVTVIALDAVHADAGASVESLLKMYEGAGVYEALGEGDAEVGKVRAAALVRECKERMEYGTNKLGMEAIGRMVAARVDEVYRASGRDLARLNPRMKKEDGVYEAWDAREEDARWHELKHLYLGLRKEFNPGLEDGLSHDEIMDEFDENAQEFYNWYAAGVGKERNDEYKAALKDWYTGQVGMKLADAYAGGGMYADGAGGYAADVALARDVLKQVPPDVLNADVLAKQREERQKADGKRAVAMRAAAAGQYAKLKGLKEGRSMEKQREEKAKKAAAEKATREEEKRRKAEEKKAQQLEQRKLEVLRARPRRAAWEWDGEQAADGESPACSLPRAEWDALVEELGYDGSTNVYVQLGSRKVLVTGYHEGTGLRLNTPAAMLLQDKKKKVLHVSGELGFSYSFK